MTTEMPKLWHAEPGAGHWQYIFDSENNFICSSGIPVSRLEHIVELHNAAEIQRVTGWGVKVAMYGDMAKAQLWEVDAHPWSKLAVAMENIGPFETPAKAIITAWEWVQQQKENEHGR